MDKEEPIPRATHRCSKCASEGATITRTRVCVAITHWGLRKLEDRGQVYAPTVPMTVFDNFI